MKSLDCQPLEWSRRTAYLRLVFLAPMTEMMSVDAVMAFFLVHHSFCLAYHKH